VSKSEPGSGPSAHSRRPPSPSNAHLTMQHLFKLSAFFGLVSTLALSARAQLPCTPGELATVQPYAPTGSGPSAGAVYFDLTVTNQGGVKMEQVELNLTGPAGVSVSLSVWTRPTGSYVGNNHAMSGWIVGTNGSGVTAGPNQPTLIDVTDVQVPVGTYGICLAVYGAGHAFTAGNGSNETYSNAAIAMSCGEASTGLFGGTFSAPIVWNGKLKYCAAAPTPQQYCAPGNSTNGCYGIMSGTAEPSASLATPCILSARYFEAEQNGLIFFGVNNAGFTPSPWGTGSSYLCVKSPLERTGVQNSGGNAGNCDGEFILDWNAFQLSHPGSLGQPFSVGQKVYMQAWYRDPPAPKSTNLTNAIEMTMQP
jgi:hypothetical protein